MITNVDDIKKAKEENPFAGILAFVYFIVFNVLILLVISLVTMGFPFASPMVLLLWAPYVVPGTFILTLILMGVVKMLGLKVGEVLKLLIMVGIGLVTVLFAYYAMPHYFKVGTK